MQLPLPKRGKLATKQFLERRSRNCQEILKLQLSVPKCLHFRTNLGELQATKELWKST